MLWQPNHTCKPGFSASLHFAIGDANGAIVLKEFECKRNSIYKFQHFAVEKTVNGCGFQWSFLRYQAAVAAIEQYGWQAIHGDAQAQICSFFLPNDHEMTIHLINCHITGRGGWTQWFLLGYHILDNHPFADCFLTHQIDAWRLDCCLFSYVCRFWGVDSTPLVCCGREPGSMSSIIDSLGESSSSRSSRWVLWGDEDSYPPGNDEVVTGKSSLDYALEAGNAKISDSALLFLVDAEPLRWW